MYIRYTDEYLLQLAILPGPNKPSDMDSFLRPIVDELNDLSSNGLIVRRNHQEVCRAKVYLMMASGDIPAVADMAHVAPHTSRHGCRICEVSGQSSETGHGMYFIDTDAPLKTLSDFLTPNEASH